MPPYTYQAIRHDGGTATLGEPEDQIEILSQSQRWILVEPTTFL